MVDATSGTRRAVLVEVPGAEAVPFVGAVDVVAVVGDGGETRDAGVGHGVIISDLNYPANAVSGSSPCVDTAPAGCARTRRRYER